MLTISAGERHGTIACKNTIIFRGKYRGGGGLEEGLFQLASYIDVFFQKHCKSMFRTVAVGLRLNECL